MSQNVKNGSNVIIDKNDNVAEMKTSPAKNKTKEKPIEHVNLSVLCVGEGFVLASSERTGNIVIYTQEKYKAGDTLVYDIK